MGWLTRLVLCFDRLKRTKLLWNLYPVLENGWSTIDYRREPRRQGEKAMSLKSSHINYSAPSVLPMCILQRGDNRGN